MENPYQHIIPAFELGLTTEQKITVLLSKIITAELRINELKENNLGLQSELRIVRNQLWDTIANYNSLRSKLVVMESNGIIQQVAPIRTDHEGRELDASL